MANFKPQLRQIFLNITSRCNYRCRMCDIWQLPPQDIPFERVSNFLQQAKELDARYVNIGKGEPLLRQDLFEIIDIARRLNFMIMFITNGSLITEKVTKRLKPYSDSLNITVSLECNKQCHDRIRGEGTFEKAVKAIKILKSHNLYVTTNTVVSKWSWPYLKELIDLAEELQLCPIDLNPFCREPLWRRPQEYPNFDIVAKDEINQLAKMVEETIVYAREKKVRFRSENSLRTIPQYFRLQQRIHPQGGCSVPFYSLTIDSDYQVYPCFFMWDKAEDSNQKSLTEIWEGEKFNQAREKAQNNQCPGCLTGCSDLESYMAGPTENIKGKKKMFNMIGYMQKKYALYRAVGPQVFFHRARKKLQRILF